MASRSPDAATSAALKARFGAQYSTALSLLDQHAGIATEGQPVSPDLVVTGKSLEDIVDAVRLCAHSAVPLIVHGAGTSLEGHLSAIHGGVSLDLTNMDRIIDVSPGNFTCRVQAGVTREQLNQHLRAEGLFFPLDPGANATIGGMVATAASGTNAVRYGTMRENVRSLQVVLADGRVIETGTAAAKSSAGYNLTALMTGSEGTLGVITEVTLRLHPIPETIAAATCIFPNLASAVDTVVAALQFGIPFARIELLDAAQVQACNAYSGLSLPVAPTLFLEFHGSSAGVEDQLSQFREIVADRAGGDLHFAELPEDRTKLWKARHDAYFAAQALRAGSQVWSTDVCVPITHLADSILAVRADIDDAGLTATIVGHVGDGNFHVLFVLDPRDTGEHAKAARINDAMVARAIAVGGTCTGEHGIGLGKRDSLLKERGPDAVAVMAAIKNVLDPQHIFNPGKIFAASAEIAA